MSHAQRSQFPKLSLCILTIWGLLFPPPAPIPEIKIPISGPGHRMNYPDGFVSQDKQWLHFAYDDNRHRAVHYSAKLPPSKPTRNL